MKVFKDTIQFKSTPEHWQKEHDGSKPNTVRYLNAYEWDEVKGQKVKCVQIINTVTNETFTREIKDITIATVRSTPVWVFSWDHSIEP